MVLEEHDDALWLIAVALFGAGDVVTTAVGLPDSRITEGNPIAREVFDRAGTPGLIAWKALVLGGFFVASRKVPSDYRIGVPLGLALVGGAITVRNTVTILRARNGELALQLMAAARNAPRS